jgi:putative membrane protein insertion efficiency factor
VTDRPQPVEHLAGTARAAVVRAAVVLIRGWQLSLSAVLPPSCRFQPSCSTYAIEALERHGPVRGTWLAMRRIARCHPLGAAGYDPVPERRGGAIGGSGPTSRPGRTNGVVIQ